MNPLPTNMQYHPLWDVRDYTPEQYTALIDALANKNENEVFATDGKSLYIANKTMVAFQKFKGMLGFENQTDPVKVDYALLKLLRYGGEHHYLSKEKVQIALEKLKSNLKKNNSRISHEMTVFSTVIPYNKFNRAVNFYIHRFYKNNTQKLQDSTSTCLFNRILSSFSGKSASEYYNEGKIYHEKGDYAQAIECLEKALKLSPGRFDYMLRLAESYFAYADMIRASDSVFDTSQTFDTEKVLHENIMFRAQTDKWNTYRSYQIKALETLTNALNIVQDKENASSDVHFAIIPIRSRPESLTPEIKKKLSDLCKLIESYRYPNT